MSVEFNIFAGSGVHGSRVPGGKRNQEKKARGRKKGEGQQRSQTARVLTLAEVGQLLVGMRDLRESAAAETARYRNFAECCVLATSPYRQSSTARLELGQIRVYFQPTLVPL